MKDRRYITDDHEFYYGVEDIYAFGPYPFGQRVFFNQRVFCSKDFLKARAFLTGAELQKPTFTISIENGHEDGPGREIISTHMDMIRGWNRPYLYSEQCFHNFPISELDPGEYVLRVSLGHSDTGSNENTLSAAEHRFFVLSDDHYEDYWRSLYGGDWDSPIYFDNITEIEVADLLNGLPLDGLWTRLSDPVQLNAETLYKLIGLMTAAFIDNEVPFLRYSIRYEPWTRALPQVDLTKLIWSLHAVSPVLANWAFLSDRIRLQVTCNADGLSFRFETAPIEIAPESEYSDERIYQLPRLTEIINESIDDIFEIEISKELISMFVASENREARA